MLRERSEMHLVLGLVAEQHGAMVEHCRVMVVIVIPSNAS